MEKKILPWPFSVKKRRVSLKKGEEGGDHRIIKEKNVPGVPETGKGRSALHCAQKSKEKGGGGKETVRGGGEKQTHLP